MSLQTSRRRIRRAAVVDSLLGTQTDQAPSVASVILALASKLNSTGNGSGLTGLTVSQLSDASANGKSLITAANYAAMKTLLGLVIGTDVLAPTGNGSGLTGLTQSQISGLVSDLAGKLSTTGNGSGLTGLTVSQLSDASANGKSLITAADYAAMKTLLGLVIGTDVLAPTGNGSGLTGLTQSQISGLVSDLAGKLPTTGNGSGLTGLTVSQLSDASANGKSLITAANYAAMLSLLGAASASDAPSTVCGAITTSTDYSGSSDAFTVEPSELTITFPSTGLWDLWVLINCYLTTTGVTTQYRLACGTAVVSGSTGYPTGFAFAQGASGIANSKITTGSPLLIGGTSKSSGEQALVLLGTHSLRVTTAGTLKTQLAIAGATSNVLKLLNTTKIVAIKRAS